jgi:hypothetical protein
MDPRADSVALDADAERIVEVFGVVRVDREREQVTQVDALGLGPAGLVGKRGRRAANSFLPQQSFENGLEVVRPP